MGTSLFQGRDMKSELVFPVWEIWFSSSKGYAIRLLWNSSWMKKKSLIVYLHICNMCNMCKSSRWSDIKLFTRALWISSKMVSNISIIVKTFLLHFRDKYGHFWIMIWLAHWLTTPRLKNWIYNYMEVGELYFIMDWTKDYKYGKTTNFL